VGSVTDGVKRTVSSKARQTKNNENNEEE